MLKQIMVIVSMCVECRFQAVSDTEMRDWIEALKKGITQGLTEMNTSSKKIVDRLCENPSNATCAECSSTGDYE